MMRQFQADNHMNQWGLSKLWITFSGKCNYLNYSRNLILKHQYFSNNPLTATFILGFCVFFRATRIAVAAAVLG